MMDSISERWRLRFEDENDCLLALSWPQAVQIFHSAGSGAMAAEAAGRCVSLEFNATHAAVLYLRHDNVILRPYFRQRPAEAQDVRPFFCRECGILLGNKAEYLARFVSHDEGWQLFGTVLAAASLPLNLPASLKDQSVLPGLEELSAKSAPGQPLEWRPLLP